MAQSAISSEYGLPYRLGGMPFDQSKFQPYAKTLSARYWHISGISKIIITLNRAVPYTYGVLQSQSNEKRIYLDLFDTTLNTELQYPVSFQRRQGKPKIYQWNQRIVRFELTTHSLSSVRATDYHAVGQQQIILEISPTETETKQRPVKRSIIIDAGHGGEELGAIAHGVQEHDVVLQTAKFLQKELKPLVKQPVLLTRTAHKTMTINERIDFANQHHGALLVSIHANSYRDSKVRGTEVYFLSRTEDQKISDLASRENEMSLAELQKFQNILTDLKFGIHIVRSQKLAKSVHKNLLKHIKKRYFARDMGVKQAPFLILFANMPAILVELEFLTNPKAAKLMKSNRYLQTMAQGIAQGIVSYLKE